MGGHRGERKLADEDSELMLPSAVGIDILAVLLGTTSKYHVSEHVIVPKISRIPGNADRSADQLFPRIIQE